MNLTDQKPSGRVPAGMSLFLAMFLLSGHITGLFVSLPFIIKRLGGSDGDVGICVGMYMCIYCLGCLVCGRIFRHYNPRSISTIGTILMFLVTVGMCVVVAPSDKISLAQPVTLMIVLTGMTGVLGSVIFPFIGGWVTLGYEGKRLGRRLGIYAASWSSGCILASLFGGFLVEISSLAPMLISLVWLGLSIILIAITARPDLELAEPASCDPVLSDNPGNTSMQLRFLWMSRISLVVGFAVMALVRTQLGILFKYELGFERPEAFFGMVIMVFAIVNSLTMTGMGRWSLWHYKRSVLILGYILLLSCLAIILLNQWRVGFFVAAILLGGGVSVGYSTHIYYILSVSKKNRPASMSVHESVLSFGFVLGSFSGGYLSDHLGRYWPYWLGVALVVLALMAELVVGLMGAGREKTE